ncbi:twin-arginine translocase subunit TatC [Limnochorda pilosa]|uniref:Sec-independent protein translocase protein TatC n=1 Tax=Limnochorda pilosa TaxID=1555112 RepID=A0A0K2SPU8_LIMPI|nr:twin-arginine translocase subunit TatC [Limnochorda pilosa]BAS29126.1 preprotein translocase subunit TatC [Limnochorda pilosa]
MALPDVPDAGAGAPEAPDDGLDVRGLWEGLEGFLVRARRRLLTVVATFLATTLAAFFVGGRFFEDLLAVQPRLTSLVFLTPTEALVAQFKLALGLGVVATYPVALWQAWQLVRERARGGSRMIYWVVPLASLLFAAGGAFAFLVVLPSALAFFLSFSSPELEAMISMSSFVNFVLYLTLPFGMLFQFPVLVYFVARVGLLSPGFLSHNRRYAILLVFIIAALLTPGTDPFSQVLLALPMLVLYEVGYLVARIAWRRRRPPLETES